MESIIRPILKKRKYLYIAITVSIILFALSYYLTVYSITGKSIFAYAMMSGLYFTIFSLLLSVVFALLFGLYVTLVFARRDMIAGRSTANKVAGSGGGIIGMIAAGCPTCGAPILAWLGFPLALMSLPFRGLELKVISIALLIWAIYLLAENIKKQLVCKIS